MPLSSLANELAASKTLAITKKTFELRARGKDIISFGAGEPDLYTPENIKKAAIKAINENMTKYTASSGLESLREVICTHLNKQHKTVFNPNEIIVSTGAKQCIANALLALCGPGDEVIIVRPCWVSYPEQVKIARAKTIFVDSTFENGFMVTSKMILSNITLRTKVVIINSPNNPTGAVYRKDDLLEIVDVCSRIGIYIISDEIYSGLIYEPSSHVCMASFREKYKNCVVLINGLSKSYAMTGWRIGYAASNRKVIDAMDCIQGHITSNANTIAQVAAIEAITGEQVTVEHMRAEFELRRNIMAKGLSEIDGLRFSLPAGGLYFFIKVNSLLGKKFGGKYINSASDLAFFLLERASVAVIPGDAFMAEGFLRFSFTTSKERIVEGIERISSVLC
jgi:aspartate aminotransferase